MIPEVKVSIKTIKANKAIDCNSWFLKLQNVINKTICNIHSSSLLISFAVHFSPA